MCLAAAAACKTSLVFCCRRTDVDGVDVGRVNQLVGVGRNKSQVGDAGEVLGPFDIAVADRHVGGIDKPQLGQAVYAAGVETPDKAGADDAYLRSHVLLWSWAHKPLLYRARVRPYAYYRRTADAMPRGVT